MSIRYASVVDINEDIDLALLKIDGLVHPQVLQLKKAGTTSETCPVWAVGYPLADLNLYQYGPEVSISEGSVSALRHLEDGTPVLIEHSAQMDPGNSGGPLVLADGSVIGLNGWVAGRSVNVALTTEAIQAFLQPIPKSGTAGYFLETNTRIYTESELSSLSLNDLNLAVNEIYARHGRGFKSAKWRDYFHAQPWYSEDPSYPRKNGDYDDATAEKTRLSDIERQNLAILTRLRDARK
jgi:hypothetical protein